MTVNDTKAALRSFRACVKEQLQNATLGDGHVMKGCYQTRGRRREQPLASVSGRLLAQLDVLFRCSRPLWRAYQALWVANVPLTWRTSSAASLTAISWALVEMPR